jgi:hypothetical protein
LRARLILACAAGAAVAAASGLAAVPSSADDARRTIDVSRVLDASAPLPATPDIVITKTPPDPPALVERSQWVFDLRWDRGDVWLVGVHPLELPAPQATPRVMGRFALELFEGPTLIERARFDFPLLGALEADGGPSLTNKLRTRIGVMFPATGRGTRLDLVDRATGRRWALPWPIGLGPGPQTDKPGMGPGAADKPDGARPD